MVTYLTTCVAPTLAHGEEAYGKVMFVEGHINPACRQIAIKPDSGASLLYFRVPDTGADNSIEAVALTAVATGFNVRLIYTSGVTTGCGSEPRVEYIRLERP
ncbi:hypothetical protein [Sphingomonas hengshuiensis]|uniref:hypothetical protein n=1 Tax=Sphingomonas hengshuiensis TaxID=1609977 RepID=UPI0012B765DC|nr:hypothetical protein [Sphingomonas hengshuiensis]